MTEIIIQEMDGDEDEIKRYHSEISPRRGETVSIMNKGAAHYTKYFVVKVDHAIYHDELMIVCHVNLA